ncbi:Mor transcription activator family protein [Veronia pacifica]|uniref:Mor transcription activator domain-containing protein n=2 Tax=Veronia pacifica TaxID=1080227 RepID=A0A1C3EL69_9GAMM|nr:hypothetical protein A8L45_08050 [Veronia pacifica]
MTVLHEIAEVIGPVSALKLGQEMGGATLYVPHFPSHFHPLVLAIGQVAAERLCRFYGGETLDIPNKVMVRRVRNQLIRKTYHGMPERESNRAMHLAREYGLSRRHVLNIVRC